MKKLLLSALSLLVLAATAFQLRRAFGALPFEFTPNWFAIVPTVSLAVAYGALKGQKRSTSTQAPAEASPVPALSDSSLG